MVVGQGEAVAIPAQHGGENLADGHGGPLGQALGDDLAVDDPAQAIADQ
jgi:hypothetical protein